MKPDDWGTRPEHEPYLNGMLTIRAGVGSLRRTEVMWAKDLHVQPLRLPDIEAAPFYGSSFSPFSLPLYNVDPDAQLFCHLPGYRDRVVRYPKSSAINVAPRAILQDNLAGPM